MSVARQEEKQFIIKKEAARGTAEALPAGGRVIPMLPASELDFIPAILPDEKTFGDAEERPGQGGIREGTGTLELEPGADKLGEFLLSLMGGVVTDQPDMGNAPTVFRHRFTRANTAENPLYTMFVNRGTHLKKYEGLMATQMTFNIPIDGRLAVSVDAMHKRELVGAAMSPDYSSDLSNLIFSDVKVEIGGGLNLLARASQIVIANGGIAKRTLTQTRDAVDILAGRLAVSGSFQLYFEDDVERDKFIASTVSSLKLTAEGQILEDVQKATLEIDLPLIEYTAAPVGESDGNLVLDFTFVAKRSDAVGYQARVGINNLVTAY